jgi:hypothetical protein
MAGSIISKMVMDTTKWKNSIKVVKKDEGTLKGMAATLAPKFKQIGRGMTIAGAAIVGGLALGVKAFKKFDLAMVESLAIMGDVSEELRVGMKEAALEMSGNSKFAASELAESYFFLASAGIDAARSLIERRDRESGGDGPGVRCPGHGEHTRERLSVPVLGGVDEQSGTVDEGVWYRTGVRCRGPGGVRRPGDQRV